MIFITPNKRKYRLVVKPYKADRDGNVVQEPVYIAFEDGVFETNDEDLINFIRSRVNFGADFFETQELPKNYGYQGHSIGIQKMETPVNEVESLKSEVNELKGLIKDILNQKMVDMNPPKTISSEIKQEDSSESKLPEKIDKRSKEYKEMIKNKE